MIKFRQKEFFWAAAMPVINGIGSAAMVGGIFQGAKQMKQADKQAKQAEEQNRAITKALNRVAENAKNNPQASQQVAEIMGQKQFAKLNFSKMIKPKLKDVGKFGKDLGGIAWENRNSLLGGTLMGASMGLSSYVTDRAIQHDMKKSGIPLQKNYTISKSVLSGLKKTGGVLKDAVNKNKKSMMLMAGLGSAPTALSYMTDKQQYKDQLKNTVSLKENSYSFSIPRFVVNSFNKVKKAKIGENILGKISGFVGGGGKKGVQDFGKNLYNRGVKSGSKTSQSVGKFILKHPTLSTAGSIPVGLGIMSATWDQGENIVKKTAKAMDNNAYAYQESKEKEIQ